MSHSLLVVAGEISGDMHLARLVAALRRRQPSLSFWGIGGDECSAAGVETLYGPKDMAVMGVVEVLKRYGFFKRVFEELVARAERERPAAAILVDYPGFNLRLAARLHALGIPVIYYVCPQVWAWHRSRIPKMARIIDRLLVIFPFEVEVFAGTGLQVDYVGHPLTAAARLALAEPLAELPWAGSPRLALLPGSRRQELQRILPSMLGALVRLRASYPGLSCLLAAPNEEMAGLARQLAGEHAPGVPVEVVVGETRQVLRQADASLVTSGTATIEAALMNCPMVVVYRTSPVTYALGRLLVKVPHIGMVNIVAGREVCPERIQHGANPASLAQAVGPLLEDTPERREMLGGLVDVREALGQGDTAERAADCVLGQLGFGN